MRRLFLLFHRSNNHSATANALDLDQFKGKSRHNNISGHRGCGPVGNPFPGWQAVQQNMARRFSGGCHQSGSGTGACEKNSSKNMPLISKWEYDAQGETLWRAGHANQPLIDRTGKTRERVQRLQTGKPVVNWKFSLCWENKTHGLMSFVGTHSCQAFLPAPRSNHGNMICWPNPIWHSTPTPCKPASVDVFIFGREASSESWIWQWRCGCN